VEISADELTRAAMDAAGVTTARQLAKVLRLEGYDSPKRIERWLRGENKPRYDETIALLDLAGWLKTDGAKARRPAGVSAADLAPALEQIADGLEKLDALVSARSQPKPASRRGRSA
jgi:hypothetical protein